MADATATFALQFETAQGQASAKAFDSALARQADRMAKLSKATDALKGAQARLANSAAVKQYLAQQKAIEATQNRAAQLEKRLASTKESLEIAGQTNVEPQVLKKLTADAERLEGALASAKEQLEELEKAQALSEDDASVKAYKNKSSVIKKNENELADLQTQYDRAGGSAEQLGQKMDVPKQGIQGLLDKAKGAGGPIGQFAGKLEGLGNLAKKGGWAAILAVIVAIGIMAARTAIQLAKFAIASADAGAKMARARQSAAFGSLAGAKEIESTMKGLRQETALSKQEAHDLAIELYRAGERGSRLDETALTIARFKELGEDASGAVKDLYATLRQPAPSIGGVVNNRVVITKDQLPRDVFLELANQLGKDGNKALVQGFTADKDQIRAALARIGEQRFAGPAAAQMATLEKLSERLHENLTGLFDGLYIGRFLGGLQKLVALLDDSTASGKAIKTALMAIAEPLANAFEKALPFIEAFFKGLIFGALVVTLYGLKIKNALASLIPARFTKNIDWMQASFRAGAAVVLFFAMAAGLLAVALFLVTLPLLLIVGAIALIAFGAIKALDAIKGLIDGASSAIDVSGWVDAGANIVKGIITGIKNGAAALIGSLKDLAKSGLDAFTGSGGIDSHSPSRKFYDRALTIPEGAALAVEDGTPDVDEAIQGMASPSALGGSGGGQAGRSGAPITVSIAKIEINGVSGAEDINSEMFRRALRAAFQDMALEGGVLTLEPSQ